MNLHFIMSLVVGSLCTLSLATNDSRLLRPHMPDEVIIAVKMPPAIDSEMFFSRTDFPKPVLLSSSTEKPLLSLSQEDGTSLNLFKVKVRKNALNEKLLDQVDQLNDVAWVSPNFVFEGDPREGRPNDPAFDQQYHHGVMQNAKAWDITRGDRAIIVAVTDDGVDLAHEDLNGNIWTNKKEIPANGKDDDGNGYIDDVNGWNFNSTNNNPNPAGGNDHGTHCAGISAATTDNAKGGAGTAGGATIMPLRFYGPDAGWTSAIIAKTYAYAANNGARIITTSYNIDRFVTDPTFNAAIQYGYDKGVLHFNSAGNNNQDNPPRTKLHQLINVCSTTASATVKDTRSTFSNYGRGVDLCAPGEGVYSTILNNKYGPKSGTSMASPNAAGVAALIWSAHPEWTREQVAAQLLATSDNIDVVNPNHKGKLGAGRVNSYRALSEKAKAPRFFRIKELVATTTLTAPPAQLTFEFDNVFEAKTVANKANWALVSAGRDEDFETTDDAEVNIELMTKYMVGSNELVFKVNETLANGKYRLMAVSGGLTDPFGTALDGNGDGAPGDNFVAEFTVAKP